MNDINPRPLKKLCTKNIYTKENINNSCINQDLKRNIISSLSEYINDLINEKLEEKFKKQKNENNDFNIEYEIKGKYNITNFSENKLNYITIQNINIIKSNKKNNILDNFIILI